MLVFALGNNEVITKRLKFQTGGDKFERLWHLPDRGYKDIMILVGNPVFSETIKWFIVNHHLKYKIFAA